MIQKRKVKLVKTLINTFALDLNKTRPIEIKLFNASQFLR